MKFHLALLSCFKCLLIFAQPKTDCNIAVYLVKKPVYCYDTATNKWFPFAVTLQDLEDTAFIKNEEIAFYSYRKIITKYSDGRKYNWPLHKLHTSVSLTERIDQLRLHITYCAKQFAIVCNGEIVYAGCLNNSSSAWVPPMVFATGNDKILSLGLIPGIALTDPRENRKLFKCLKKTNRFRYLKKKKHRY